MNLLERYKQMGIWLDVIGACLVILSVVTQELLLTTIGLFFLLREYAIGDV